MNRRRIRRFHAVAWLRLLRPFTTAAVALAAAGLVLAWGDGAAAWHVVLRYALGAALIAAAAAADNDDADAALDSRTRLWRPIPAGQISGRAARIAAAVLAAAGIAIAGSNGPLAFAVAAGLALCAAAYSHGLRGSPLGWLAFALAAILLPLGAALSLPDLGGRAVLWWAAPVGASAGLAAFAVCKLPDFERDDEDGARGVLHWIGIDAALPLAWGATAAALAFAVASVNIDGREPLWLYAPLGYLLAASLGAGIALVLQVSERRLDWQRALVAPGLLALLVGWFGAIGPG